MTPGSRVIISITNPLAGQQGLDGMTGYISENTCCSHTQRRLIVFDTPTADGAHSACLPIECFKQVTLPNYTEIFM